METATQPGDLCQGEWGQRGLLQHLDVTALFVPRVAFGGQLPVSVNLPNLMHNSSYAEGQVHLHTQAEEGGSLLPIFPGAWSKGRAGTQCPLLKSFSATVELQGLLVCVGITPWSAC